MLHSHDLKKEYNDLLKNHFNSVLDLYSTNVKKKKKVFLRYMVLVLKSRNL